MLRLLATIFFICIAIMVIVNLFSLIGALFALASFKYIFLIIGLGLVAHFTFRR